MARYADGTHQRPKKCRECGKPRTDKRHVSRNGLCIPCATRNLRASIVQQKRGRGPIVVKQARAAMEAARRRLEEAS